MVLFNRAAIFLTIVKTAEFFCLSLLKTLESNVLCAPPLCYPFVLEKIVILLCAKRESFGSVEIYCGFRFRSPLYSTAILNLNCSLDLFQVFLS